MTITNYPNGVSSFGVPVLGGIGGIPFTGRYFFVNPVTGADGNEGTPDLPLKTLYAAHRKMTAGNNDVAIIVGNGSATGTARLSNALAQADAIAGGTTVSVGTLVWSKNACHIIGLTSPSNNKRARISNVTTETITTFGSGSLVTVTAEGCYFANFSVYQGFATGGASEIAWTDSGGRNYYDNVEFLGGGDTAATGASVATMRSLLISGTTGENVFNNCVIGLDTLSRSTGSQELELTGGSPRNVFNNCIISTYAGAVGCFWMKIGAGGIDRYVLFRNCTFTNPVSSAATAMTTGFSVNAAPGGAVLLQNCLTFGATKIDTAQQTYGNTANAESLSSLSVASST